MVDPAPSASARAQRFVVGVTGASGAIYARRFVEALLADPAREAHLIVTPAGQRVAASELDASQGGQSGFAACLNLAPAQRERLRIYPSNDIGAGPASGTFRFEAMVVVPCSMNSLASIARGHADNLLARAAAVALKEGRPLIVVPRETPFTLIDLRNMTALAEAGGIILPANPAFYHRPQSANDVARYIVQKIFDRLGLDFPGAIRWGETHR